MELQRLAAKQKRYQDIKSFTEHDVKDASLRAALSKALQSYKQSLAQCWNKQSVGPEDELLLCSIERTLDTLHNEARLLAHPS